MVTFAYLNISMINHWSVCTVNWHTSYLASIICVLFALEVSGCDIHINGDRGMVAWDVVCTDSLPSVHISMIQSFRSMHNAFYERMQILNIVNYSYVIQLMEVMVFCHCFSCKSEWCWTSKQWLRFAYQLGFDACSMRFILCNKCVLHQCIGPRMFIRP